jgi:hypothetical protein
MDGTTSALEVGPASLVFEFAVQSLPSLGLFLGIQQWINGALIHRYVGAVGNLEQAQHVLGFFFHPLVATDGGYAKDIELLRLKEDEDGLLVAGSGTAGVLVDDDSDFLGGGRSNQESCQ